MGFNREKMAKYWILGGHVTCTSCHELLVAWSSWPPYECVQQQLSIKGHGGPWSGRRHIWKIWVSSSNSFTVASYFIAFPSLRPWRGGVSYDQFTEEGSAQAWHIDDSEWGHHTVNGSSVKAPLRWDPEGKQWRPIAPWVRTLKLYLVVRCIWAWRTICIYSWVVTSS